MSLRNRVATFRSVYITICSPERAREKEYYRVYAIECAQDGWPLNMAEWWSIEVFSGDKLPASRWKDAYGDELTEAAVTNGAVYWECH